ncbi:MAG: helix-turn-helix domain-containing protein [Roseicyclus sp.]|jgi:AraC family carnitine catabolism transcriptional activator
MPDSKAHFAFVLQPEFPLNALILASDSLRIANQNSGRNLFEWRFLSEDGAEVHASNGMWFAADGDLTPSAPVDVCLLFQGNLPTQNLSRRLLGYLRTQARFGAIVGGVDTGAYALAQAGLVATETAPEVVLHWEAVPTFREWFPEAQPLNGIYLSTETRVHCAGGVATLDLMLDLIARFAGEAMASEVANAMVHTRRPPETQQRLDQPVESHAGSLVSRLTTAMEQNLDFPLSLDELAEALGTPKRTLARASETAFGISPMRLYLRIRLQAARNYLFYEDLSIKQIATACGFSVPAAFTRSFKIQFGVSPSAFRAEVRNRQRLTAHPEIHRIIGRRGRPATAVSGAVGTTGP